MDPHLAGSLLASNQLSPLAFHAALESVPETQRDSWVDSAFGLEELPQDGDDLPRGCVPYLPCPVNTVLRALRLAEVQSNDVFVDIGSGLGRAIALAHLLTGAGAIGVEVQSALARSSRNLATRLNAPRIATIEGDAARLAGYIAVGSVFFLYCPFGIDRAHRVLDDIEWMAEIRQLRVCSVDMPLLSRPWLQRVAVAGEIEVYRSRG